MANFGVYDQGGNFWQEFYLLVNDNDQLGTLYQSVNCMDQAAMLELSCSLLGSSSSTSWLYQHPFRYINTTYLVGIRAGAGPLTNVNNPFFSGLTLLVPWLTSMIKVGPALDSTSTSVTQSHWTAITTTSTMHVVAHILELRLLRSILQVPLTLKLVYTKSIIHSPAPLTTLLKEMASSALMGKAQESSCTTLRPILWNTFSTCKHCCW